MNIKIIFKQYIKFFYIIIIITSLSFLNLNSYIIFIITYKKEIENIEKYFKLCNKSNTNKIYYLNKTKSPKVSIISPIYNRGKYLDRFLKSIQNQNFNELEIILIDDFSSDNTLILIKLYQNIDKRIILIRNKKNYGTFKSRNLGILASKGEYVILPDPDDILSENSLKNFYIISTKYKYEMIRFNIYFGHNRIFVFDLIKAIKSRPVFQPELKTYLYYATGRLRYIDFNISNKFIKRLALIKALNLLGKKYLNIYMKTFEDQLLNFILYRTVKSFYFLKSIGYYYIINPLSISTKEFKSDHFKNIFINLKIIFSFTKNNIIEKNMFNSFFRDFVIGKSLLNKSNLLSENKEFYINTIDLFLVNDFVSIKNKNYMIMLKKRLIGDNNKI